MTDELAARIKSLAGASAADLIGIAPGEAFSQEELGELGQAFGPVRSIIVLAQHIIDPVQIMRFFSGEVHATSPIATSFGDAMLRNACWQVVEILREAGYHAAIPRNLRYGGDGPRHGISYKKAGVLAGLGSFGKNQLLIHPEWGPWMYLRTVISDAALPRNALIDFSPCDRCASPCFDACPAGALSGRGFDRPKCEGFYAAAGNAAAMLLSPHGRSNCEECLRACAVGPAPPRLVVGEGKP
jgi:hypothetical protein